MHSTRRQSVHAGRTSTCLRQLPKAESLDKKTSRLGTSDSCLLPSHSFCMLYALRTPWSNCYRTATASELIWLRRNVTGGRFSNLYQRAYFACTNLANHRRCTKLLAHWQWRGRSRCGLSLLQNTQSFWSQSAHTAAYRVCWAIQI